MQVAVEDSNGNIVAAATNPVTLTLVGGTGLGGTLTVTPQNGIATFSNLTVSNAGAGKSYALKSAAVSVVMLALTLVLLWVAGKVEARGTYGGDARTAVADTKGLLSGSLERGTELTGGERWTGSENDL